MMQPKLASAAFQADPYPYWRHLRESASVYRAKLPDGRGAWLVTRYSDAIAVLRDPTFLKDPVAARGQGAKTPWMPKFLRPLSRNMLDLDGEDHARLRRLVHRGFTPRRVEALRARITEVCAELLHAMPSHGTADLVSAYALPLPVTIIAEMIGIPEGDRHAFHAWTQRIVAVTTPAGMLVSLPAVIRFMGYIRRLIEMRRREPADDLLSALISARDTDDALSEDEIVAMIILLLIAGHETTVNLIACGTLALMTHPGQMERLRAEPDLMGNAVEELARYVSPVSIATERFAASDMEIAGSRIARGDQVLVVISSANRDETEFQAPDTVDIGRETNRHLAFGQGIHYCVGAPLARMEVSIALEMLLQHRPHIANVGDPALLRWRKGLFLRGVHSLPVRFGGSGLGRQP